MCSRSSIVYRSFLLTVLVLGVTSSAPAATLNVPGTYATIQAAIDAAESNDTIIVAPGTYFERIDFLGKAITVTGTDTTSLAVVQNTVINGGGSGSVVTFANGEGPDSILKGFTITGGYGTAIPEGPATVRWGGGILCYRSSPTITCNVIAANTGPTDVSIASGRGGGVSCFHSNAVVMRNVIVSNSAFLGGGVIVSGGEARVSNNLIYANTAFNGGGVELERGGKLLNNTIIGNRAAPAGGGNVMVSSDVNAGQCLVSGNIICNAAAGGGLVVIGVTDSGNVAYNDIWNNAQGNYSGQTGGIGQNGNISADPRFVNAGAYDYHLQDGSPCINAGDPDYQQVAGETDLYGRVRVHTGRVDIGAAEYYVPPVANAGDDIVYSSWQPSITLDGSGSSDSDNGALKYHWRQLGGWVVALSDPNVATPSFMPLGLGEYLFELVVSDDFYQSVPDVVRIVVGNKRAPVADAGPVRYVSTAGTTLDGSGSYDPEGGRLTYQWTQVSGPLVTITGASTATPIVSGFRQTSAVQTCVFRLVVNDGELTSQPATVRVVIVPSYGASTMSLANPPFDPQRPTIVAFGGGNCSSGGGMTFGGIWNQKVNWITFDSYAPPYARYGEMLMVYLSSVAPRYTQPIQMMGFSTGNKPTMGVARYLNQTYSDPRFAINRVSLLDAVCNNLSSDAGLFQANPIAGEQSWVDNYISNDPAYNRATVISGVLNTVCDPARSHGYPVNRYAASSFEYGNGGITAFGCLSVIGEAKNYQLKTSANKYYFRINPAEQMVFFNQSLYPGKILQPVALVGPGDGAVFDANGAVFTSQVCQNATGYQLLFGSDPCRVMDFSVVSDTPAPPTNVISKLPFRQTWWTVRAYDQYGSTIYADPMLVKLPDNRKPLANAGPDMTIHVKIGGTATITLSGSGSSDPDGDQLAYRWAWALGTDVHEANDVALTLDLPIGVHTFQLMASDGMVDSLPDEVTVAVIENVRPIAEAGPDRTFYADHTGRAAAFVDASASWDPEGRPLTYLWNWTADGSAFSSTAVAPTMDFAVGTWPFSLVVNDGLDDSSPDTCTVNVVAPIQASLMIVPRVLNAQAHSKDIGAIFTIPGITRAGLDPAAPITLWPFGIQAKRKMVFSVRDGLTIMAFFDAEDITAATPQTSRLKVEVETKLKDGHYAVGSDYIMILHPPKRGR